MNLNEQKYRKFSLVREMLETPDIIKNFISGNIDVPILSIKKTGRLMVTGEGSSRIFPAKNMVHHALKNNPGLAVYTEGARQAAELNLSNFTLLAATNSGKTREVIDLFRKSKASAKFAITQNPESGLKKYSDGLFLLKCGEEKVVPATKSVIEEALFYHSLLLKINGKSISGKSLEELSQKASKVLKMKISNKIISKLSKAKIIYFAGRNNGVAEEAALKANEITRKKSCYLEGTYAVHGIEEAMDSNESIILIEPYREEEQKFREVLVKGVGMHVVAISSRKTIFPTIRIPKMKDFNQYLQLFACWNLLIEIGIKTHVNMDMPRRARKIGNRI